MIREDPVFTDAWDRFRDSDPEESPGDRLRLAEEVGATFMKREGV